MEAHKALAAEREAFALVGNLVENVRSYSETFLCERGKCCKMPWNQVSSSVFQQKVTAAHLCFFFF